MGIKDNFSQAVKELWKKDGQEQTPAKPGGQPTELDSYLRQGTEQVSGSGQPAGFRDGNVPLETPYYRSQPQSDGAGAQNTQNVQNVQNNQNTAPQNTQGPQNTPLQNTIPDGEPGVNLNVQNIRQNFGQNSQNVPDANGQQAPGGARAPEAAQNQQPQGESLNQNVQNMQTGASDRGGYANQGGYAPNAPGSFGGGYGGGGYVPPAAGGGVSPQAANEIDETTIISKNTVIDGNIRSLANMQIDGNIKGNVETTRNIDMSGKIVGDITCNNAGMNSAAMQGNVSLKGRMRMDRDTILIGDLSSQYADINGRIRGKLDIVGKAELKRDAIVFGDINASTIAVTDGAIIQGYVNTTFLSKEDSRNVFPEAISLDNKEGQGTPNAAPKA